MQGLSPDYKLVLRLGLATGLLSWFLTSCLDAWVKIHKPADLWNSHNTRKHQAPLEMIRPQDNGSGPDTMNLAPKQRKRPRVNGSGPKQCVRPRHSESGPKTMDPAPGDALNEVQTNRRTKEEEPKKFVAMRVRAKWDLVHILNAFLTHSLRCASTWNHRISC